MKELQVTFRVRNNRLLERRHALSFSQLQMAEAIGIFFNAYSRLETMRDSPYRRDGHWRRVAKDIAAFHCVDPEELFPPGVLSVTNPVISKLVDVDDLPTPLPEPEETYDRKQLAGNLESLLSELRPRESLVVRRRFGLNDHASCTLEEVAKDLGLSKQAVKNIETQALYKLRKRQKGKACLPDNHVWHLYQPPSLLGKAYCSTCFSSRSQDNRIHLDNVEANKEIVNPRPRWFWR